MAGIMDGGLEGGDGWSSTNVLAERRSYISRGASRAANVPVLGLAHGIDWVHLQRIGRVPAQPDPDRVGGEVSATFRGGGALGPSTYLTTRAPARMQGCGYASATSSSMR